MTRRSALGRAEEDLVVAFAQKLELLCLLVHKDTVEVARLHGPDLDRLVAPSHDLPGPYVGHGGRQLSPLQHDVLGNLKADNILSWADKNLSSTPPEPNLSVCVHIDALVVVAEEKLHAVRVGQHHDGVRRYGTGGVLREVDIVHGG